MLNIINKQNRGKLHEGRTYQMGFAFCKKDGDIYTTVQPISPCKDYLNDVVYAETTGKQCIAYGLTYKKEDIFDDRAYLALAICQTYHNYNKDVANLSANYKNAGKFINKIEELLKIEPSEIQEVEPNLYLFNFSLTWVKGLYAISLLSLLLRVSQWYDGSQDVFEYLKSFKEIPDDIYMINGMLPKLNKLIEVGMPEQDLSTISSGLTVHNSGVLSYKI